MSQNSISKSVPRKISVQAQIIFGFGFILLLVIAVAMIGYTSFTSLQAETEAARQTAGRVNELGLQAQNAFFLARQQEANFLADWRNVGIDTAIETYVAQNEAELERAHSLFHELGELSESTNDPDYQPLLVQTDLIHPLLDSYENAFADTVSLIEERSRSEGLEESLKNRLDAVEITVQDNGATDLYQLVLQIRSSERSYFGTKEQQYIDNHRLLVNRFNRLAGDLPANQQAVITSSGEVSDLLTEINTYATEFQELVSLEEAIKGNTLLFQQLTADIIGVTANIEEIGARNQSITRQRLNNIARRSTNLLIMTSVLAVGFGIATAVGLGRQIILPIRRLSNAAIEIGQGNWEHVVSVRRGRELIVLAEAFNSMVGQIQYLVSNLEKRVDERTRALKTSTAVSRELSTILDSSKLAYEVVTQIKDAFDYYHAHIYLFDEVEENLVMVGGTGVAGEKMLARGHKLVKGQGLVGRAAITNAPVLIPDVTKEPGWLANPLLPDTKSELAVPIAIGDNVRGVIDIQQDRVDGLDEQDVELLQSIANQVAVGLQNIDLFAETKLAEAEAARFKFGIERSDNSVFLTDVAGVIQYVNPAFEKLYGYTAAEAIGQTPRILKSGLTPREQYAALWENLLAGHPVRGEITNKTKDGRLLQIDRSNNPIIDASGELVGFLSVHTNITERKQAEAALAKQANELAMVAQVSTAVTTIMKPTELLQTVADLVKDRFNLYHAHIHLLNEAQNTLVLTAGAGDIGRQMVAEGRRIPLAAAGSLVATVARTKKGEIRNYETPEEGFMPHPLLLETRSEMAVPIILGDEVLGVLDVRSDELNYFGAADMQVINTLAGQVAVALQNARSFQESQKTLHDLDVLTRRLTREGWGEFLATKAADQLAYGYDLEQVTPISLETTPEPESAAALYQPIRIQNTEIGALKITNPQLLTDEAQEIIAAVSERLGAHIENLRLTEQTQSALAYTETLYVGSERIVRATTMNDILVSLVESTGLAQMERAAILLFDKPWEENPETATVVANWTTVETEEQAPVGTTYSVNEHPTIQLLQHRPFIAFDDAQNDEQVDPASQKVFEALKINSIVALPLTIGDQWLGYLTAQSSNQVVLGDDIIRQLKGLTDQAAVVAQSLQLFEAAQELARQEQLLREITTRIHAAVDAESILRTAAEEIGRALGLEGNIVLEGVGTNSSVIRANGNREK